MRRGVWGYYADAGANGNAGGLYSFDDLVRVLSIDAVVRHCVDCRIAFFTEPADAQNVVADVEVYHGRRPMPAPEPLPARPAFLRFDNADAPVTANDTHMALIDLVAWLVRDPPVHPRTVRVRWW